MDSRTDTSIRVGEYMLHELIGSGSCAEVRRARHEVTGYEVAMKIIDTRKRTLLEMKRLTKEREIHIRLHHQNIIRLHEIIEIDYYVILVLELARGGDVSCSLISSFSKN